MTFKRKDTLLRHERTIHGEVRAEALLPGVNNRNEPYKCFKCKSEFKDKNTLIRHMESIHENVSFECDLCQQIFTRKDNLQVHMRTHANKRPKIICEVCRQEFTSKPELRAHRINIHER